MRKLVLEKHLEEQGYHHLVTVSRVREYKKPEFLRWPNESVLYKIEPIGDHLTFAQVNQIVRNFILTKWEAEIENNVSTQLSALDLDIFIREFFTTTIHRFLILGNGQNSRIHFIRKFRN